MYLSKKKKISYNYINKDSKKPVLVFLHGLGANSTTWKGVISNLKNKNLPILYQDLRGHGKSEIFSNYELEEFAKDLNEILKKEKIKKIILIGHSLGGMISLVFYKLFKNKVRKIILIDTTYKNPVPVWYRYFFYVIDKSMTKIINKIHLLKKSLNKYRDFYQLKNQPNFSIVLKTMFYRRDKVQLKCIKNLTNFDATNIIKSIEIPTLIIGSKYDELFPPKIQKEMHKYIKASKLEIMKGTHAIIIKNPDIISREISSFIKDENQ
ncbi:alpha/beta hydrolase [Candidatus Woesearchaeota archaeon]|nr:alpha/beta hydrolase [Candidatus Woesearchaeota archaeon]